MILLCGIPSETSLAIAVREVEQLEVDHVVFNQRRFASMELEFDLAAGEVDGELRVGDSAYPPAGLRRRLHAADGRSLPARAA